VEVSASGWDPGWDEDGVGGIEEGLHADATGSYNLSGRTGFANILGVFGRQTVIVI